MVQSNFESKVKIQEIINNQIPDFILEENPKFSEFLKQYYISQEYQSSVIDIIENLPEYLKLDNLKPEIISGKSKLTAPITESSTTIYVNNTKGFPNSYGLIQIDDEIITYKEKLSDRFIGCIRGFSGIKSYDNELIFDSTESFSHSNQSSVINLSVLFLQKFYEKIKFQFLPGLESVNLYESVNVNNFIKNSSSFYRSKGTRESFRILFNALYKIEPTIVDLESFLFKTSSSKYKRRKELLFENLSTDKNPLSLIGYQITKNNDSSTFGSVSEIEIITRNNKIFYKFYLFIGYDDSNSENSGEFQITPATKVVEKITSSNLENVLTVDSTIGFPNSGSLYCEGLEIFYTNKSINQFFGCYTKGKNYIDSNIKKTSIVYSNDTYYGYENGDKTKRVDLRLLGVISGINEENQYNSEYVFNEGDKIYIQNLGNLIDNKYTYSNPLANSFVYNTSSRYELNSIEFTESRATTLSQIDKSSLKVGDSVEFLERNTEIMVSSLDNVLINSISGNEITFNQGLSFLNPLKKYDIRRKLKTSTSSIIPLKYNNITSDVINLYTENDNYYVASSSLPSYEINSSIFSYDAKNLVNYDNDEFKYTSIKFNTKISFLTGDIVYYSHSDDPIDGLEEGLYYISVSADKTEITLYRSRSFIGVSKQNVYFSFMPNGTHNFTLFSQKTDDEKIYPQNLLKKIVPNENNQVFESDPLGSDMIGILSNGVEIFSYKSTDKIYYGSLKSINIFNKGEGYDVINPPSLELSYGNAKLQPIVQGSIEKVYIDPQEFNLEKPVKLVISGGNGKNAVLTPIISLKSREVFFDARRISDGGGLNPDNETITFLTPHNFLNGQKIIYDINNINNTPLGIGTYQGLNFELEDPKTYLSNNSSYYVEVINDKTIKLYPSFKDSISGINTIGFTFYGNKGIHKFKTEAKKILSSIVVENGGSGFTNRKLIVNSTGISTYNNTINFTNHGFSSGELITYNYQQSPISGLSTSNQYYVLKVDSDSFRVCNAGIAGTDNQNYLRENYVKFLSSGSGYQYFNYPEITVNLEYTNSENQTYQPINITPVVKGSIIDAYIYEKGSNYGSTILNLEKIPDVKIVNGKFGKLTPLISDGKIIDVLITYYGIEYYSIPDLIVESKSGTGAILRAKIQDGKIVSVVVIDGGYGYNLNDTEIKVISSGKNAFLGTKINEFTLDNSYKYGIENQNYRNPSYEILSKRKNNTLQYAITGYSQILFNYFKENENNHSPIIGWSYDGIPIYGPFGYSNPESISKIKRLESGYSLKTQNELALENRIAVSEEFPIGYFIEDYKFDNSKDLDEYNGRFCKTPEYPNGIYAYFASTELNDDNQYSPKFPYFIGINYRSKIIQENINYSFNQEKFDFINSKLLRNTLPYKSGHNYGRNDFISNNFEQILEVENTLSGNVEKISIINNGYDYKVGDSLNFNTDGSNLLCVVESLKGKKIKTLNSTVKLYENSKIYFNSQKEFYVKNQPNYDIIDGSLINISGLTSSFTSFNGDYQVFLQEFNTKLNKEILSGGNIGIVTDIYLEDFPKRVSIGSSIKINSSNTDHYFKILNYFENDGVLRVERTSSTGLCTATSVVSFLPDAIFSSVDTNWKNLEESYLRYFNPVVSVGVGTTPGVYVNSSINIGTRQFTVPIPTQSIYLPNHKFRTGQKIILRKSNGSAGGILVSNSPSSDTFYLLNSNTTEEELFAISKSKDFIGVTTSVGISSGVYFRFTPDPGTISGVDYHKDKYSFEPYSEEILCNVLNVNAKIVLEENHNLKNGDLIDLEVIPQKSVGIGESTSVNLKYIPQIQLISTNILTFTPNEVNLQNHKLNLVNHNLKTGDKVFYISTSVIGGLKTDTYYVHKVDLNNINLCETYIDSISTPPIIKKFTTSGIGTQEINLIQSEINVIKNNDLVFNVSDSSLKDYKFKLYYDPNLTKEYISAPTSGNFSIIGVGTVGVSSTASITLKYSDKHPKTLYYSLEKNNNLIKLDNTVNNSSQINFIDSYYSGKYKIFNAISTSFNINLQTVPEKYLYEYDDCKSLNYSTYSETASGPVDSIKVISSNSNYKDIPSFVSASSTEGKGLYVIPYSTNIGKIKNINLKNSGFEYTYDTTLSPKCDFAKIIKISSSNVIENIDIDYPGQNYSASPTAIIIDSNTREKIDSGVIKVDLTKSKNIRNSGITNVYVDVPANGLPSTPIEIKTINNDNGIIIDKVYSSNSGIITCILKTPISGFSTDPFIDNEEVFVEGIEIIENSGRGFNSENHGYQFFKVIDYITNSNPGTIKIKIPVLYGNPGEAVFLQNNTVAKIIKKSHYPSFKVTTKYGNFLVGEQISIVNVNNQVLTDLIVQKSTNTYLKVNGKYKLNPGDKIQGLTSNCLAKVEQFVDFNGSFRIGSNNIVSLGWEDEIGKTSNDLQFTPDNDYYQNLSYTIKSEKTWDEVSSIVNSTIHPIGTKNFVDTQVSTSSSVTRGLESQSIIQNIQSFTSELRVDVIKNFDLVRDFNPTSNLSSLIKFENIKLTNFIEAKSNRVLQIDDISDKFASSDADSKSPNQIIKILSDNRSYGKFLIQIRTSDNDKLNNEIQFTEFVVLKNDNATYSFEKSTLTNKFSIGSTTTNELNGQQNNNIFGEKIGDIIPIVDESNNYYLVFKPKDELNIDYEIKILDSKFTTDFNSNSIFNIGSTSYIFSDVIVVPQNQSKEIFSADSLVYNTFVCQIQILNKLTSKINYVELYVVYDKYKDELNYADYYFGIDQYEFIGSFDLSVVDNKIKIIYSNNTNDEIIIKLKTISLLDTGSGTNNTYRFKSMGQSDLSERTVVLQSGTTSISSASTIFSFDKNLFTSVKSLVEVSIGSTICLHQLMTIHDDNNSFIMEYPSLLVGVGNTIGIGTFSSSLENNELSIKFTPLNEHNDKVITFTYYNEIFYRIIDIKNNPLPLEKDPLFESISVSEYISKNSKKRSKLDFVLNYKQTPIFAKYFDPNFDVNLSTGLFTIPNHFFSTGEKLIYEPDSSFIGLGKSEMGIPSSQTDTGITTTRLPRNVYAIKISKNEFKLALTEQNAKNGNAITFTDVGVGNAHVLEMSKKNEKCLIAIDNLIQYPLYYTGIAHSLAGNNGQISTGSTFFTLSGISSIKPTDMIKIDNEYMKVLNVGIGTSNSGPITFFNGDKNIVEVERGFVGSSATTHLDDARVEIYKGSFNIVKDTIYFTSSPKGNTTYLNSLNESNLLVSKSKFNGRVFLRNDYSSNFVFDDISSEFTGIGQTFTLKSNGNNVVGLGTTSGNGILLINGIYQTPLTENVTYHNFRIVENKVSGISTVIFSGVKIPNTGITTISDSDINRNQLPRGGIIVSMGSTTGLGYAPLVGSVVKPVLNNNGEIVKIVGVGTTGNPIAFSTVSYNNKTGILDVFTSSLLGIKSETNQVKLVGLAFTCSSNSGIVSYFPSHDDPLNIVGVGTTSFSVKVGISTLPHYYVGYGTIYPWYGSLNFGSGYRDPVSIDVIDPNHNGNNASISVVVGSGGTLSFTINSGGSGYVNPLIRIPSPSYENLPVIGVSRLGVGTTTDTGIGLLMNVEVSPSYNNTGIGTTLFSVSSFKITRQGYNFKRGDVFTPVGLVTAKGLAKPIEEFKIEVLDTFTDSCAIWQFGEMDLIDSIKPYQNGTRLTYPLYYNGRLLSFQYNPENPDTQDIDFDSLLVIFINGILQEPKISYEFTGGSAVTFLTSPKVDDLVEIYFYVGTRGSDSETQFVEETIKIGDTVQIYSNNSNLQDTITQDQRTVYDFSSSSLLESNLYSGKGIDVTNLKPIFWTKQKEDLVINDVPCSKSRRSLESKIYPTAKIIKDFSSSDNDIFVDNASFFDYEKELPLENFNLLIIPSNESAKVGIITAIVSTSGTIQSLNLVDPGSGYISQNANIKVSNPYYGILDENINYSKSVGFGITSTELNRGIGIGTTAEISASISNGLIVNPIIVNPGYGYTNTNPPQIIVEDPSLIRENVLNVQNVTGFEGVIIGIATTAGIGTDLALKFTLKKGTFIDGLWSDYNQDFTTLNVNYPIYIFDTYIGNGIISINDSENYIIGIGTTYLNNIYQVHGIDKNLGIVTCNISKNSNIVGIATTGTINYPVGKFSWGKISGFNRSSNPISIGVSGYTVNSGLSSYPFVQRRGGKNLINLSGAIKNDLSS